MSESVKRNERKTRIGKVVSDKMQKTIVGIMWKTRIILAMKLELNYWRIYPR